MRYNVVRRLFNFVRLKRNLNPRLTFQLFSFCRLRWTGSWAEISACPTRSQPDSVSRYPSCDTLICNSSNSVLGLPNTSLHLQIPSPFICKSNVGMTTLTYGGTMFSNIGWIGVSKSSEKSSRSLTVCWTIGGSVSSEETIGGFSKLWKELPLAYKLLVNAPHHDLRIAVISPTWWVASPTSYWSLRQRQISSNNLEIT